MILIFDVRSGDIKHTDKFISFSDKEKEKRFFNSIKSGFGENDNPQFLIDLRDETGDILDTVGATELQFKALMGTEPKSQEEYSEFDAQIWTNAKKRITKTG